MDPYAYPIDVDRYRRLPSDWIGELDQIAVHAGEPHQRMATRGVDEDRWLRFDDAYGSEMALRRRLHDEARAEVFAALDGSEAASTEVAGTVQAWLDRHHPDALDQWDDGIDHPLARAGLAVHDDLCVMERHDEEWRLTAALLCFPTYWRLGDKIGHPVDVIHGPVPHYEETLAPKVSRFFDRLAPGRIVSRRNWSFTADPLLFVPDRRVLRRPERFDPAHLWLRSELQTLRRLPRTGAVLFTIRIQLAPAVAVAVHPAVAARMVAAMASWTPALVESRGGRHGWMGEVAPWLAALARRHGEPAPI